MAKKIVIVGGVAGGASAAARLRRLDETAEIIMFERDEYVSFANCGLPYYIGENIKERSKLLVQTPESLNARFNIDVRVNSEVIGLDPIKKTVKVRSKAKGEYEESYDYVVLSPGAKAIKPNVEGINSPRVLTLRNIPDTDAIKAMVDTKGVNNAIVIGGGYVGVEMAENLLERGMSVKLVEAAPHIMAPFDTDIVLPVEKELEDNGIKLILNDGVKAFRDNGRSVDVILNSGTEVNTDLVVLAIGVIPDTAFLKETGIKFGPRGHILVNEKMETGVEGIYAVGDAIEVIDYVSKNNTAIPLAGPANKQGRIAADNICGLDTAFKGTQGTSIIKVFGLTAASTGNNERMLKKAGIEYKTVTVHPVSHASYYPGALPLTLKLVFGLDGKILGAQATGYDGVDKRIDVIATALRMGGTVKDLTELELCYAPPFSSAKDPVNMAGFVAENILAGRMDILTTEEYMAYDKSNAIILDVRTPIEFEGGHIDNAINIEVDELRSRIGELDKSKEVILYCQVGLRGYVAASMLTQHGFKVKNITGGYKSFNTMFYKPKKLNYSQEAEERKRQVIETDTQLVKEETMAAGEHYDDSLDACGLCCPGPLLQVKAKIDGMENNEILKVSASDPGFFEDIKAWCVRTNNQLLDIKKDKGNIVAFIKKTVGAASKVQNSLATAGAPVAPVLDNKTMVVFSGDLDKAIASFIIANGAAAMGKKVTMFFTFWGLNILRKTESVPVKKNLIEKAFGIMMPRGSKKLKLSNMNMGGMGAKMIRMVMKNKNILSLEDLIGEAQKNGINIVACTMSMDVMGIKPEELIDGVNFGGVGYYLGEAEDSNVNLFI